MIFDEYSAFLVVKIWVPFLIKKVEPYNIDASFKNGNKEYSTQDGKHVFTYKISVFFLEYECLKTQANGLLGWF